MDINEHKNSQEAHLILYRDINSDSYICRVVFFDEGNSKWKQFDEKADILFGDILYLFVNLKPDDVPVNVISLANYFLPEAASYQVSYYNSHCQFLDDNLNEIRYVFHSSLNLNIYDLYFSSAPGHSYIFYDKQNNFSLEGKIVSPRDILSNKGDRSFATVYFCFSLDDVLYGLLHFFATQSVALLKCERCNKWFIPDNTIAQKYCKRFYGEMNCSQLANKSLRAERGDTPITSAYHRVDNMLRKRKNSDPEHMKDADQKIWNLFRSEYKTNKKIMSNDELLSWLEGQAAKLRRKGADDYTKK